MANKLPLRRLHDYVESKLPDAKIKKDLNQGKAALRLLQVKTNREITSIQSSLDNELENNNSYSTLSPRKFNALEKDISKFINAMRESVSLVTSLTIENYSDKAYSNIISSLNDIKSKLLSSQMNVKFNRIYPILISRINNVFKFCKEYLDTIKTKSSSFNEHKDFQHKMELGKRGAFSLASSVLGAQGATTLAGLFSFGKKVASGDLYKQYQEHKKAGTRTKAGLGLALKGIGMFGSSPGPMVVGDLFSSSANEGIEKAKAQNSVLTNVGKSTRGILNTITMDQGGEGVAHKPTAMMLAQDGKPESFKVTPGKSSVNGVEIKQGGGAVVAAIKENTGLLKQMLGVLTDQFEYQQDRDNESELKSKGPLKTSESKGFSFIDSFKKNKDKNGGLGSVLGGMAQDIASEVIGESIVKGAFGSKGKALGRLARMKGGGGILKGGASLAGGFLKGGALKSLGALGKVAGPLSAVFGGLGEWFDEKNSGLGTGKKLAKSGLAAGGGALGAALGGTALGVISGGLLAPVGMAIGGWLGGKGASKLGDWLFGNNQNKGIFDTLIEKGGEFLNSIKNWFFGSDNGKGFLSTVWETLKNTIPGLSAATGAISKGMDYVAEKTGWGGNRKTTIDRGDGTVEERKGGTVSWRNNNPGNMNYGDRAKQFGAVGADARGFAIFKTKEQGDAARQDLLFGSGKGNMSDLTISQMTAKYAPVGDPRGQNDPVAYAKAVAKKTGVDVGTKLKDLNPQQRNSLMAAMQAHEGWEEGTVSIVDKAKAAAQQSETAKLKQTEAAQKTAMLPSHGAPVINNITNNNMGSGTKIPQPNISTTDKQSYPAQLARVY